MISKQSLEQGLRQISEFSKCLKIGEHLSEGGMPTDASRKTTSSFANVGSITACTGEFIITKYRNFSQNCNCNCLVAFSTI